MFNKKILPYFLVLIFLFYLLFSNQFSKLINSYINNSEKYIPENYEQVCILPPYASRFVSPYIKSDFDKNTQKYLNDYLNKMNFTKNSENHVSLIFLMENNHDPYIIKNIRINQASTIIGFSIKVEDFGKCFYK